MVSRKSNPNRGSKPGERRGGRAVGTPNKVTQEFRETVRRLLEDNAENVAIWLAQVAASDPDKALDKLVKLAEFAAPKLNRTEVSGPNGDAIEHNVTHGIQPSTQAMLDRLSGRSEA